MPESQLQSAPPSIPIPPGPVYFNWFFVNTMLPLLWLISWAIIAPFIFIIFATRSKSMLVVGVLVLALIGLSVVFTVCSLCLNVKICRPYARGSKWLHLVLVVGSTCLSILFATALFFVFI